MYFRVLFLLLFSLMLLSACSGKSTLESEPPTPKPEDPNATPPTPGGVFEEPLNPYAPGKGDESLTRDKVLIDSQEIMVLESYPPQFQVQVRGSLPTPCHELRAVIDQPDEQSQIHVQVYSLFDPDTACAQGSSPEPFEASIPLGSTFPGDHYTVFVNGEEVGEIDPVPLPPIATPQASLMTPLA